MRDTKLDKHHLWLVVILVSDFTLENCRACILNKYTLSKPTYLAHPERHFIDLVDGHKCLHVVKEENIVEDGSKESQRAIEHCSGEGVLPKA